MLNLLWAQAIGSDQLERQTPALIRYGLLHRLDVLDSHRRRDAFVLARSANKRTQVLRRLPALRHQLLLHQPAEQGGRVLHLNLPGATARLGSPLVCNLVKEVAGACGSRRP